MQMVLMERLGWIPATTLLFMATARAFGSRRWIVDGALGLAIAVLSFVIFNYGLELNLPAGILADLIEPTTLRRKKRRSLTEPGLSPLPTGTERPPHACPCIKGPKGFEHHGN